MMRRLDPATRTARIMRRRRRGEPGGARARGGRGRGPWRLRRGDPAALPGRPADARRAQGDRLPAVAADRCGAAACTPGRSTISPRIFERIAYGGAPADAEQAAAARDGWDAVLTHGGAPVRPRVAKVIAFTLIGARDAGHGGQRAHAPLGWAESSSYATASDGLAGYAALLMKSGHPVSRLRTPPWHADLDPRATVVMLDPNVVLAKDVAALRSFVEAGGRLIAGGTRPGSVAERAAGRRPDWTAKAPSGARTARPRPRDGRRAVRRDRRRRRIHAGRLALCPSSARPHQALATVVNLGAGRIVLLADSSPLQNHLLAQADNARSVLRSPARRAARSASRRRRTAMARPADSRRCRPAGNGRWSGSCLPRCVAVAARIRRLGPPSHAGRAPAAAARPRRRARLRARPDRAPRPGRRAGPGAGARRSSCAAPACRTAPTRRRSAPPASGSASTRTRSARSPRRRSHDADVLAAGRALAKLSGSVRVNDLIERVQAEVGKVVVGQDEVVELMLSALVLGGHVLLQGVPGVAKSLLANAFARTVGGSYRRVQFTPDMLPSDLTGTMTLRGASSRSGPARCSRTSCSPTRSTARRRRRSRRCSRRCRSVRSRSTGSRIRCPTRSSSSRRRTRSSTRAPIRSPRPSSTASCSRPRSAIRTRQQERAVLGLDRHGVASPSLERCAGARCRRAHERPVARRRDDRRPTRSPATSSR